MNAKQKKFVNAYLGAANGNGTAAARMAGYSGSDPVLGVTAHRLLKNPKIADALAELQKADPLVADRDERQRFLTAVMRADMTCPRLATGLPDMKERLKAVELLGKMGGDYVQRIEAEVKGGDGYQFFVERAGAELNNAEASPPATH